MVQKKAAKTTTAATTQGTGNTVVTTQTAAPAATTAVPATTQSTPTTEQSTTTTQQVTTMENMLGYNGLKTILTPKKTGDVICNVPGTFLDDDSVSHQTLVANAEKSYRFQRVSD